eukprot:gene27192-32754_t
MSGAPPGCTSGPFYRVIPTSVVGARYRERVRRNQSDTVKPSRGSNMASRVFRSTALIAVVGAGLLSAACTIPTETAEATTSVEVSPLSTVAADVPAALTGKVVFLDPGHSGANDDSINTQVPTGRGGTKNCQTTGTNTDAGFPEHTFNWEVASLVKSELEGQGATVVLSRPDDISVGSCVDARAEAANSSGAD